MRNYFLNVFLIVFETMFFGLFTATMVFILELFIVAPVDVSFMFWWILGGIVHIFIEGMKSMYNSNLKYIDANAKEIK